MPGAPTTQRSGLRCSVAAACHCTLDRAGPLRLTPPLQTPELRDDPSDDTGPSDADRASFTFQRIHDLRLVRAPALQGAAAAPRHSRFLVHSLLRILSRRASEPNAVYSAAELKTIQEVLTLSVFAIFSVLYLKEPIGLSQVIGFGFIALGAFFVFSGRP